ncbi:hypothetical protein AYO40_00295 [Planctomycetaceae bacterium SCGC AG-212-D15]|nr:hypothetical protein AYO40_00295 [Planctomycetaceae bacterium SCGC AG-212-D15]
MRAVGPPAFVTSLDTIDAYAELDKPMRPPPRAGSEIPSRGQADLQTTVSLLIPSLVPASAAPPAERDQIQTFLDDVHSIAESLARIADHVAPLPSDIVGTPYIAQRLGCTTSWITELIKTGEIPKNCIVEGTGNGKPWKFHRRAIEEWIKTR